MGSVNSSIISVSVKRKNYSVNAVMTSLLLDYVRTLSGKTSESGQDLDRQSALLLLTIQLLLQVLQQQLALPLLLPPHTAHFGEMESGQSTHSAEPGPKSPSVPCLAEGVTKKK